MLQAQPFTPTIVRIVPPQTQEVGVLDVLVGSLGLTGVIVLGSIVMGAILGAALISYKKWRENRSDGGDRSDQTRLDLSSPSR